MYSAKSFYSYIIETVLLSQYIIRLKGVGSTTQIPTFIYVERFAIFLSECSQNNRTTGLERELKATCLFFLTGLNYMKYNKKQKQKQFAF